MSSIPGLGEVGKLFTETQKAYKLVECEPTDPERITGQVVLHCHTVRVKYGPMAMVEDAYDVGGRTILITNLPGVAEAVRRLLSGVDR